MPRVFQGNACFDRVSGRRRAVTFDITDETKPTLMQRANETLVVAAVAERAPSARRAALMRELSVASETMRPCQIASKSSSLLTIRSRLRMR